MAKLAENLNKVFTTNVYAWSTKADHVIVMPISVIFDAFRSSLVCFNIGPAIACSHIIEYCKWVLFHVDDISKW